MRRTVVLLVTALMALGARTPRIGAQVTYTEFTPTATGAYAAGVQPTGQRAAVVTLEVQDSTIRYVVRELARQAHLRAIDDGSAALERRISLKLDHANVMDAFAVVLRGTGLVAKVASDGETVVIRGPSGSTVADRRFIGGTIIGRVTDSTTGAGLGGAAVRIAGTKLSIITSDSGHFTLKDVPPGDQVLSVRLFGYKPVERTVTVVDSEQTAIHIVMVPVPTVLSGVVTTATGLQRKIEVGNDITTLNVDSIMQVAPIQTVTDLLETRVPGLTVLHSSGTPGDPSRLRLRGAGSIQLNNDPIVIVDGIRVYASQSDPRNQNLAPPAGLPGGMSSIQSQTGGFTAPSPLDQIDPASIETIEVLKGPSATAIYGSDAASGVIVITTKHGRAGPTRWNLALADGVNWDPGSWPTNYFRFGTNGTGQGTENSGGLCWWNDRDCAVDSIVAFQALNDPLYTVFSHGSDQQANLTVSGGLPTLTYSLSASGSGDLGMLKLPAIIQQSYDSAYGPIPKYLVRPDNYTTWGVNGSLTAIPHPALRVTLQSSLFTSDQQQSSLDNAITQLEGEYVSPSLLTTQPLIENAFERATDNSVASTDALSLHWQLAPWFPLDATGGLNTIQRNDVTYTPYGINACAVGGSLKFDCQGDTTGFYGVGNGTSHNQTLTAGTTIPLRSVELAFGGNLYSESTGDFAVSTNELAPGVSVPTTFLQPGGLAISPTWATTSQSTYGWYVQPTLNLASRFFASPGFRLDGGSGGSTSSGSIGGLSAFPKIDLSYVAVDRQGEHPLWGVLTLLRPRLAFGLAGTQPLPQDKLRLYNVGAYQETVPGEATQNPLSNSGSGVCFPTITLNGTTTVPAVCLNSLGNSLLRPERSRELEGGFDASLWQGRLSLTYTQYNKTTLDALLNIPVAPSVGGIGEIETNIGEIRNTGTELTVNATVLESRALSWNVGANLSNDNNLVVHLEPGQQPICLGTGSPCSGTRIVAGYPLFGVWAQPIASFADANHDGIIEPDEIRYADSTVYVGQPNPKYQLNLTTNITLFNGRLSANATFAYQNGLTQDNQGACQSGAFNLIPNAPNTPLATQAAIVAAGCGNIITGGGVTPIGLIQTVNTFRFNDLSINYNVPKSVSMWFRVPRMTVALQGSNLALRTNYRGLDPDVNAFSTVSAGDETEDLGEIPQPRTWWLRMTFGN